MAVVVLFVSFLRYFSVVSGTEEVFPPTRAYVTVSATGSPETETKPAILPPFVTEGTYATIGAVENAKGNLCLVDSDFLKNFHPISKRSDWIALIYDDDEEEDRSGVVEHERDNRGNRKYGRQENKEFEETKKKSLTDKMKDIILLGASALIIMVKNVRVRREFHVAQVFTKPIVFLHGVENVTKILRLFSLQYDIFVRIQKNFPYYSAVGTIGTVTLWATCGRSTSGVYHEWQGVVCTGNGHISSRAMDEYFAVMAWNACFLFFIGSITYVYIRVTRTGFDGITDSDNETENEILARHVLSQMRVEVYRSRRISRKRTKKSIFDDRTRKKFENWPEQCVICLDEFFPRQRLRVLPCKHCFHLNCIDKWLLMRQTCPMCKFNILEQLPRPPTENLEEQTDQV